MVSRESNVDGIEEQNDIEDQEDATTEQGQSQGPSGGVNESPLEKTQGIIDELLGTTCEIPMWEVSDLAKDAGIKMSEILGWAEKRETCFVDWDTGHIRCQDAEETDGE